MTNPTNAQEIYLNDLRTQVRLSKTQIYKRIRKVFHASDQSTLRRYSWVHCMLITEDEVYHKLITQTFKDFTLPIPITTSKQDLYHHLHLTNTFLLSLFASHQLPIDSCECSIFNLYQITKDPLTALEMQLLVYANLLEIKPSQSKPVIIQKPKETEVISDDRLSQIEKRLSRLEAQIGTIQVS